LLQEDKTEEQEAASHLPRPCQLSRYNM